MANYVPMHMFDDHVLSVSRADPVIEELRPAFKRAAYATDQAHRHDYYEIYLIESGSGTCTVDGRLMEIGSASVSIFPPGSIHAWERQDDVDGFVLRTPPECLAMARVWGGSQREDERGCFNARTARLSAKKTRRLLSLIEWIADEDRDEVGLRADKLRLCLASILDSPVDPERSQALVDLPTAFLRLLERKHHLRWSVNDYAHSLGTSRATLLRTVRDFFGKPPRILILERTMVEAERLLSMTSMTCSEISDSLGFASQAEFSRTFKRYKGTSPSSFGAKRKMCDARR